MKKKMFLMACLIILGIQVVKAQLSFAALHHEGAVTLFSGSQIQSAIDNAVAGDTIYLSEGAFNGFSVAKDISIIGTGVATTITDKVAIGASTSLLLSNMYFIQDVETSDDHDYSYSIGLKIIQCVFANSLYFQKNGTIEIMHSFMKGTFPGQVGDNLTININVSNSKVKNLNPGSADNITLINCNIGAGHGTFQNCIINQASQGDYKNCLYKKEYNYPNFVDCYQSSDFTLDDDLNCSLTDAELAEKGYLGTDGKVVGINGGDLPFTLESPILQVTEHQLDVDNVNKQLKVTLKLGNK